jgi:ubiquinone/menaquinone biosynthesis C-methylase UbiE
MKNWNKVFIDHSNHKFIEKIRNHYYSIVLKYTNSTMVILDVGCGRGDFLKVLKGNGYNNLYGIDPEPSFSDDPKEFNFKKGTSLNIPFKDNCFDCIYIFCVLHHLKGGKEYNKTILEVRRCLKSDGLFIIIEPTNKLLYYFINIFSKLLSPFSKAAHNLCIIYKYEWGDIDLLPKN